MKDSRRRALKKMLAGSALLSTIPLWDVKANNEMNLKGNINHSVCGSGIYPESGK